MASAAAEILQATDAGDIQVTETDAALLREILLEEEFESELEKDGVEQMENESKPDSDDDMHKRLEQNEENIVGGFDNYWSEMVEVKPSSPLVDESMAWYIDDKFGTTELDCNIDYSQLYSGVFMEEETTTISLWQD
ncbi:hypothetical protein DITRI_Ditri13aG0151800 [Diplodiscus trichospermus]